MGAKEGGKTFTRNNVPGTTLSHVVMLSVCADVSPSVMLTLRFCNTGGFCVRSTGCLLTLAEEMVLGSPFIGRACKSCYDAMAKGKVPRFCSVFGEWIVDRGRIGHAIEGFDVDRGEIDCSCTCVYPNPEMQDVQGVGRRWISSTADKILATNFNQRDLEKN
jgi:hypothetical protein